MQITEKQYQFALKRIEDLLPHINDDDPNQEEAMKLSIEHYPILKSGPK